MKPIRARITVRIHDGEIVVTVSDGEGDVSLHRLTEDVIERAPGEVGVGPDGADDADHDPEPE